MHTNNSVGVGGGPFWKFFFDPYENKWSLERVELAVCKVNCFYPKVYGKKLNDESTKTNRSTL